MSSSTRAPVIALAVSVPPSIVRVIPCPERVLAPARNSPSIGVRGPGRSNSWRGVAAIPYDVPAVDPRKRSNVIGVAASS